VRKVIHEELMRRLGEPRRFLQVLAGPRQVGKTTLVRQVMAAKVLMNATPHQRETTPTPHDGKTIRGGHPARLWFLTTENTPTPRDQASGGP
jgi:GTPase SAR1 family protein